MDKMILKMSRHNIQTVTVTQNLSDLKNTGNETVNAIIETVPLTSLWLIAMIKFFWMNVTLRNRIKRIKDYGEDYYGISSRKSQ